MGQRYCSVPGCHSYFKRDSFLGVIFHRFPTNPERKRLWIQAVRRKNPDGSPWNPGYSARICSLHFIGHKKCNDPDSPSYVPTNFPHHQVRINALAAKRYHRKQKALAQALPVQPEERNETIFTAKVQLTARPAGDEAEETESVDLFDPKDRPVKDRPVKDRPVKDRPVKDMVWSHQAVQTTAIPDSDGWDHFEWQHEAFPGPHGKWSAATQVCIPS